MSRSIVVVAVLALVLGVGALILQFALPSGGEDGASVKALETRVALLETKSGTPLRVAYINAEEAFSVFTEAVADLREKAMDKQKELLELQQQYLASTVSKEEY